jgi:neutral ceramidase
MTTVEYARGHLRVGAASVDITPAVGVAMQGYKLRYAESINDPLLASVLAVGRDRVEWLLLSVDNIGLDRTFTIRVREAIGRQFQLASSAITITCSHTHSGPATLPKLGPVVADAAYLSFLEQRLAQAAEGAAAKLELARWRFGVSSFPENVNRRMSKRGRIELGVNPSGPVDDRLRVLRIDPAATSDRQAPLALIVHYACHATSSADVPHISADWPGAMRTALQRVYGENGKPPVICFLQGCTGDLTHRIARDREAWPQHFDQHTSVQALILGRLAAAAALGASERSLEFAVETIQTGAQPLELPFRDCPGSEKSEVQVVRIGQKIGHRAGAMDAVWFIGLPGEPFTHYSTELGRQFQRRLGANEDKVLVCGYTNDDVGYICTSKALRQGGYEAAVAHEMYHRPSPFSAATEAIVLNRSLSAAHTLAEKTMTRWAPIPFELLRR